MLELLLQKKGINILSPQSIERRTQSGSYQLSYAQLRLWFMDQLEPHNPFYNITVALRLRGKLEVRSLERALNEIGRRHETLRTSFTMVDTEPAQVISPAVQLELPLIDLSQFSAEERDAETRREISAQAQQPFDLREAPLVRVRLLRLSAAEHVLIAVLHHIISDGWSMGILVREVGALYTAFTAEQASPLPELSVQYADYAVWQREQLQGEVLKQELAYWQEQLRGAPPVLELATDHARPAVQSFRGAREGLKLSGAVTAAVKELSRCEGVTLFMTLLTAFGVLLGRYSGQEEVVIGTPIAGRTRAETEGLIGFFVNTLALRLKLEGDASFQQMLQRVREVCLGAYAHQEIPFERLVEELAPERSLSRTPLFQVMLNLLNLDYLNKPIELPGLTVESLTTEAPTSKFDLTLYVVERDDQLEMEMVYNTDLFERARIIEMLGQLDHLLSQIVERPNETINQYSLVTPAARRLLPDPTLALNSEWEGPVYRNFSRQACRVPVQTAVVDKQEAWSYRELDSRSNQLANYLIAHGIKPQQVVAIYGHRSVPLVWALLGVWKAGAAFVILDPSQPASRLVDCLRMAQPRAWLQVEEAGVVPGAVAEYVSHISCRGLLPQNVAAEPADPFKEYSSDEPELDCDPDGLAYVAFTSGSSGRPKGIMGTHRPLSHFLRWHSDRFGLSESDRFSMLSGLSHDPLLRDIFTPLLLGSTLCIPDPEDMRDSVLLAGWMERERISVAHLTPGLGQVLAEASSATTLKALRYVFFGGDLLRKKDVSRLQRVAPSATFVNFYGTTETPQAVGHFIIT